MPRDVGIAPAPGAEGTKGGAREEVSDPIEDWRTQQPEIQQADMDSICCYK